MSALSSDHKCISEKFVLHMNNTSSLKSPSVPYASVNKYNMPKLKVIFRSRNWKWIDLWIHKCSVDLLLVSWQECSVKTVCVSFLWWPQGNKCRGTWKMNRLIDWWIDWQTDWLTDCWTDWLMKGLTCACMHAWMNWLCDNLCLCMLLSVHSLNAGGTGISRSTQSLVSSSSTNVSSKFDPTALPPEFTRPSTSTLSKVMPHLYSVITCHTCVSDCTSLFCCIAARR